MESYGEDRQEREGGYDGERGRGGRGGRGYGRGRGGDGFRGGRGGRGGGFRGGRGGGYGGGFNAGMTGNVPKKVDEFQDSDRVSVKIRGLPYQTRFEEVTNFFSGKGYIDRSVVLGTNPDGRKNGFGAILFNNEDDAQNAVDELNGEYVGSRYVELSIITYGDYSKFNGPANGAGGGKYGGQPGSNVKLSKYVGQDNQDRALLMRGCPWTITSEQVMGFFEGFGALTAEDIFIEEYNGKRTGSVLVLFENTDVAQNAKEAKNKETIGAESRYVELYDQNDEFMMKVCDLAFTE